VNVAEHRNSKRFLWVGLALIVVVVAVVGYTLGWRRSLPVRLASTDWRHVLAAESYELHECAECHEAVDYHTCDACHDDHGALEFADLPFYALITLAGDVPEPGFIQVHEILPYQNQPGTNVRLVDFLSARGIDSFESLTLISDDGGFVTLEPQALTDRAWLLPYEDGIRFACEDLHVSSWLKGITKLIVVSPEKPLLIDGVPTSMGRLLLSPTVSWTVEQAEVSLRSESDGEIRKAAVASRLEGVPLRSLFKLEDGGALQVETAAGETLTLDLQAASNGFLTQFRGRTTLVLPERGRSEWITGPTTLEMVE
jgi:hypothetical protein